MYQVQMQYLLGNSQIWVAQLTLNDPIYNFDNEVDAQAKANELTIADPRRAYKVVQV
jgi:hypothetical protein